MHPYLVLCSLSPLLRKKNHRLNAVLIQFLSYLLKILLDQVQFNLLAIFSIYCFLSSNSPLNIFSTTYYPLQCLALIRSQPSDKNHHLEEKVASIQFLSYLLNILFIQVQPNLLAVFSINYLLNFESLLEIFIHLLSVILALRFSYFNQIIGFQRLLPQFILNQKPPKESPYFLVLGDFLSRRLLRQFFILHKPIL